MVCFNCLRPDCRVSRCKFEEDQDRTKKNINLWKEINYLDLARATFVHTVFENIFQFEGAWSLELVEILLAESFSHSMHLDPSPSSSKNGCDILDLNSSNPHPTLFRDAFHSRFLRSNFSPPFYPPPSSTN